MVSLAVQAITKEEAGPAYLSFSARFLRQLNCSFAFARGVRRRCIA